MSDTRWIDPDDLKHLITELPDGTKVDPWGNEMCMHGARMDEECELCRADEGPGDIPTPRFPDDDDRAWSDYDPCPNCGKLPAFAFEGGCDC